MKYRQFRSGPLGEAVETVVLAVVLSFVLRLFFLQAFYIPSRSMEGTLRPLDHIVAEKFLCRFIHASAGDIVIFELESREASGLPWNPLVPPAHAGSASDKTGWIAMVLHRSDPSPREYVKRVIGRGGDRISFEQGRLLLGGQPADEPYLDAGTRAADNFALRISGRRVTLVKGEVRIDGQRLEEVVPHWIPGAAIEDRTASNFAVLEDGVIGVRRIVVPDGFLYLLGDNRLESADSRYFGFVPQSGIKGRALMTYWPLRRMRLL